MERVARLASERAVVIFTKSGCCMCHTLTSLFGELAVSAAVHELAKDPMGKERERERELARRLGHAVPAVVIGGTSMVMSMHLTGELVPMLKTAGALRL